VRWDRLFDDLEAQAADLEREERDALVDELRDGDWAQTRWRHLVGGRVTLEVVGGGRVDGIVTLVNDRVLQISGDRADHVVAASAVLLVQAAERRADPPGRVSAALGWGHVFRALRDAGEEVVVRLVDGSSREGVVDVVGGDFVRLTTPAGRSQDVVWTGIVMVSGRT
jgi:PAS domain-containing protein